MESLIEDHLRTAYTQLDTVQRLWISIAEDTSNLDDILNQLEQRRAINRTVLTGTNLNTIPDLKNRLLSKIDIHITEICQNEILSRFNAMRDELDKLKYFYETAGRYCHLENNWPILNIEELENRAEIRPSFNELFSWLDESMEYFEKDLDRKWNRLELFQPGENETVMEELRRLWKIPFVIRQRWNWIRFHIDAFMEWRE